MDNKERPKFTVITNGEQTTKEKFEQTSTSEFHTNPMYEKLLNFRNLQEQQKKRFSVEDLLRW